MRKKCFSRQRLSDDQVFLIGIDPLLTLNYTSNPLKMKSLYAAVCAILITLSSFAQTTLSPSPKIVHRKS